MKKFLFLLLFTGGMMVAMAQQVVTIRQIQERSLADLNACNDDSPFLDSTVTIFAVVVTDGSIEDPTNPGSGNLVRNAPVTTHHNIWVADSIGRPWSGIDVFHLNGETNGPTTPTSLLDLVAGDSVKITGTIDEFRGTETEIFPTSVELIGTATQQITAAPVQVSDFNNDMKIDSLQTGERWEGVYVEFYDAEVDNVTVTGDDRVFIDVRDAAGNIITLSDRFLAQQQPVNGGSFTPPAVGTVYDTLRGVIEHSRSSLACASTDPRSDGYQIYPFKSEDYVVRPGNVPPGLSGLRRDPAVVTSSTDATITVVADDPDGGLATVSLFYAIGEFNTMFTEVAMTDAGANWEANIPASAYNDGDFVKIYACATDVDNLSQCFPDVPGGEDPQFFIIRDNGATIRDVQFTPYADGVSSYRGYSVTVQGIVTSTTDTDDLGFVYIQQSGESEWAGLNLTANAGLNTLSRGDMVEVTGDIEENFGFTRMSVTNVTTMSSGNALAPVEIDPNTFTSYDPTTTEPFESMLVTAKNPTAGQGVYVVNKNPDGPGNNFAEYRIGSDRFDDTQGLRVLAGRRTGSAPSSLVFGFVNDSSWIVDAGAIDTTQLKYPICVVNVGDTMCSMTGIMYFSFSNMKLLPRNDDDVPSFVDTANVTRPAYSGVNCRLPGGFASIDCANLTTSNEALFAFSDVSVFPNPAANQVSISYDWALPVVAQLELRDMMGRVVASQEIQGQNGQVDLNVGEFAEGAYMLIIRNENQIIAQDKVLIVR
ncbi:MAG: T9SS type A sorting domain-containing protein [Bacteroidota bacterium]